MHQSNPGVRRLRVSQPSIHLPRSVYLPSTKIGVDAFSKFSFGAKNSSLATNTAPPRRSEARSISSVKSIAIFTLRSFASWRLGENLGSRKDAKLAKKSSVRTQ